MRVLALDAATAACSAALLVDGACVERYVESTKGHAAGLLDMARQVLAEGQCTLSMLDGLAASVGPGAFTGVRISVAVAQGLAFGADLASVPVSTLEALSYAVIGAPGDCALACLDARMGEVYWGWYGFDPQRGVQALAPPDVSAPGAVLSNVTRVLPGVARTVGVGRGFGAYPDLAALLRLDVSTAAATALPRASHMARLGALRLAAGEGADASLLEPQYLRNQVAMTETERAAARALRH
jgi:tRNA threonylcarbamoyladenosine biosynthesis protein TsaB